MFLLPKGTPLADVPVSKLQLPEALDKLKNGKLTGYASFQFSSADCALLYDEGRLISAVVYRDGKELRNQEAIQVLVDLMLLASGGDFRVYSFSREIVLAIAGMLTGTPSVDSEDIKQVDFKGLLEKIKAAQMTGTLKIFTPERAGLIFYKSGATVGFFHDASSAIETSAGPVQQIAGIPGAKVDLRVLRTPDVALPDLSASIDIKKIWESASGNIFASPVAPPAPEPVANVQPQPIQASSAASVSDIENSVIEIAYKYVGKLGKTLAEKELMNIGGPKTLKDEKSLSDFLSALEKGSKLLASGNKIKEMKEAITLEAAKL